MLYLQMDRASNNREEKGVIGNELESTVGKLRFTVDNWRITVDKMLFTVDKSAITVDNLLAGAARLTKVCCLTGYGSGTIQKSLATSQKLAMSP